MSWIKMRTDLKSAPAVLGIAELTGLDVHGVIGRLHLVWSWADSVSRDGHVRSVTPTALVSFIDREVAHLGFVEAMVEVGWLRVLEDRLTFPNFDRHMSQSAKNRGLAAERQSRKRRDSVSRIKRDRSVTREEKIREDKNTTPVVPFVRFWDEYPRRVAKLDAEKAWNKIPPDQHQTVLTGLAAAKRCEQWQRDGGKFVPYPATWLNGRRWEDDPELPADEPASAYAGTKEWLTCARCQQDYCRVIGKPDEHECAVAV